MKNRSTFAPKIQFGKMDKITTREDYQRRVDAVLKYIDRHIDANFSLDELACVACFSRWHFQHIMHAFLGEPVWTYVMRRRVETAMHLLRSTELPVSEIAWRVGYDAPSSFNKAFRQFCDASPLEYRNNKQIRIMKNVQITETLALKAPKIVTFDARQVIYLELTGEYSTLDFGGAYKQLWQCVKENKLYTAGIENLAIYFDDPKATAPDKMRTHICLVIHKPVEPQGNIKVGTIEGGKYAKFTYIGPYSGFEAVYDAIYSRWLPESGCTLRDSFCFEKYINDPSRVPAEKLKTEIYVPII